MKKFFTYIKDSIGEVVFIKWPTREQTAWFTVAVIVITLVVAYYLGFLDVLFARVLEKLI
jgi:preprotein translocase SecE subunit